MTPLRAHGKLVLKDDNLLLLTSSSSRRIIFFALFVVFAAAMIVGFDAATDLSGSRLFGTIGYAAVLIVLLGVSAWSKTVRFDCEKGRMTTVRSVLGVAVGNDSELELTTVTAVLLQKVQLIKGRDLPLQRSNRLGSLVEPRSQLWRLFLDTGDGRIRLDESNYREELEQEAATIAGFLGVVRKLEEI
jgi:hypothetical protein